MRARSESEQRILLANPDLFLVTYFPHRLRKLEEFHLRLIETATTKERGLVLYPAAHGKTTLVSTLLPIHALCVNPNVRIAIITKNDKDARGIMQAIQAELLGNEELIADFGPFDPEEKNVPFGLERLSVAKRTLRAKEPTLAAFGAGARSALGHRTDWTICDDIVTDKNSATPEQREKLREWFNLGPETMIDDSRGRLTVVGTLFDPADLYNDLIGLQDPDSRELIYDVQREDAILDEEEKTVLWPDRRPWGWLMKKKASMGTLDFNKRYRNIAVDKSRMVFRDEYVRGGYLDKRLYPGCLDRDYRVGDYEQTWRLTGGFDPAIGVTKTRKFCAHVVLAAGSCQAHENCLWVVDLVREQLTLPQQVETILDRHAQYGLVASYVEANSYQAGLHQAVLEKMEERGVTYRIDAHYTTRVNKPDPELGIQRMSPWFENSQVHIPWADAYSQRLMNQLVEELVMYPGRYTDTVMAFWMAWRALNLTAPRFQAMNRMKRMAWGTTRPGRRVVRNPYYAEA